MTSEQIGIGWLRWRSSVFGEIRDACMKSLKRPERHISEHELRASTLTEQGRVVRENGWDDGMCAHPANATVLITMSDNSASLSLPLACEFGTW